MPDRLACLEALARSAQRLTGGMRRELRVAAVRLETTERRLKLAHPGVRLQQQMQRLDDLSAAPRPVRCAPACITGGCGYRN